MKKKKTNKQTNIFSRTYIYIADFFQVWKVAGQISSLFHEFKTLHEPTVIKMRKGRREELKPVQLMHPRAKPVKIISGALEDLNVPAAV